MNLSYLDSSVLLSLIFKDSNQNLAKKIFTTHQWVSSKLLSFECTNVLIRESVSKKNGDKLLGSSLKVLSKLIEGINIIPIDDNVLGKLASDRRISKGRTLDSIHIASALLIQDNYEGKLKIATFDKRLAELAKELGFEVI